MKKSLTLFAALSVMCTAMHSQPLTGINTYQYSQPLVLTDGTNTSFNSQGFLLAGVLPGGSGSSIYMSHTDGNGNTATGGSPDFTNEYKFAADMVKPCGGNISSAQNCYGVSSLEIKTNPGGAEWYAITSAFDRGCLFSTLDKNGDIVSSSYYTFPVKAVKPTKPVIAPSAFIPNVFFITGSYQINGVFHVYTLSVDINGNPTLWGSWDYVVAIGAKEFIPSAIIESPYASASGTKQIIIVGTVYDITGLNREGFFLPVDFSSGLGNPMLIYGSGGATDEQFLSISIAKSGAAGLPGYLIGGYSDYDLTLGSSWMLKLDPFGNIEWSTIIPSTSGTRGAVVGVVERANTYGTYDCYGAATENKALTVFKLDDLGNMFSNGSNTNNEFSYNDNIGGWGVPVAISNFVDATIPGNEGIQVVGTNQPGTGDYLMARVCYNGAAGNAGCSTSNILLNNIPNAYPGPTKITKLKLKVNTGLPQCTTFFFADGGTNVNVVSPCNESSLPTTPYSGDQSRNALATGIKANTASDKFSLSPNPVTDRLNINYTSNTGANVSIGLYNNLGQLVTPVVTPKALQGTNTLELDLSRLNINSGVYFVTVTTDGASTTKKIIYTK